MSRSDGAHTHSHNGGGIGLVAIVVLILIAASAKPAEHAAHIAEHILSIMVEVLMIGLAVLVVLAVAAALTWAGARAHRRYTNRAAADDEVRARVMRARADITTVLSGALDDAVAAEIAQTAPQAIDAPKPRLTALPGVHSPADIETKEGA
jgi:nitrogen fixation protein FixH